MKRFLTSLSIVVLSLSVLAPIAEAKRFGGGGSSGMQRSMPQRQAPNALPARPATPQNAAAPAAGAAAAAAAPKRSWMGPVAGLAAGLGIAALASHLGMGEGLANMMTMLLLAGVAFFVIRLLMNRFGRRPAAAQNGMQFAGMGAQGQTLQPTPNSWNPASSGSSGAAGAAGFAPAAAAAAAAPSALPADFDVAGFERIAKMIFIRMQAANDAGDQADLRAFTTPEMFAAVKLDLQDRKGEKQQTDVVELNAQVLDYVNEATQQVVTVRFHGLIREVEGAPAEAFDEMWHLVSPHGGNGQWAIAGVAPYAS